MRCCDMYFLQVKPTSTSNVQKITNSDETRGLGDSDSDDDEDIMFDPIPLYKQILEYLRPGETVSKTLCRLGKYNSLVECVYSLCQINKNYPSR